jgi:hypothetical protein
MSVKLDQQASRISSQWLAFPGGFAGMNIWRAA